MGVYDTMTVVEVAVSQPLRLGSDLSVTLLRRFKIRLRARGEALGYAPASLPYTLLQHPSIPKFHEIHQTMFGLWVTDIALNTSEDEPNSWEIMVTYEAIDVPKRGWADVAKYTDQFGSGTTMGSCPFPETELPWHQAPRMIVEESGSYEEVTGQAFEYIGTDKLKADAANPIALYTSTGYINYVAGSPIDYLIDQASFEPIAANVPIINILGDPYMDPPAINRSLKTYTWQWCVVASATSSMPFEESSFWYDWQRMGDTINATDIRITGINIDAFTGKVKSTTQELLAFMGFPYYKLGLTVEIKDSGWVTPILNDGTRYRPTAGAVPIKYNNESGGTPTVKLDKNGLALDPMGSDISTPFWNIYVMQPWKSWNFLSLPSEITPTM